MKPVILKFTKLSEDCSVRNSQKQNKTKLKKTPPNPQTNKNPFECWTFQKLPLTCSRVEIEEIRRGCAPHCLLLLFIFVSFVTKVFRPLRDGFELLRSAMHRLPDCGAVSHLHSSVQTAALSVDVKCIYLYEASRAAVVEAAS